MGKKVFIDAKVFFRYPQRVSIGSYVSINRGTEFYPSFYHKEANITLGNNIRIGPGVKFLAAGHDYTQLHLPDIAGKIIVEDNVWIGANAVILQSVTIGKNAVVAAGAVVSKDVPSDSICGGVPARVLKQRILKNG